MYHWVYVVTLADINFLLNQGNVSSKSFLKECIIKTMKWKHKVKDMSEDRLSAHN